MARAKKVVAKPKTPTPKRTPKQRAKVVLEFPEKLFYEKVLLDWKDSVDDRNRAHVIKVALKNLKLLPIDVNGYSELRKVKGIGEDIATRLDAAWKNACKDHFNVADLRPSLVQVRSVKRGEALQFLEKAFVSKGRRGVVPFLPKNTNNTNLEIEPEEQQEGASGTGAGKKRRSPLIYPEGDEDFERALAMSLEDQGGKISSTTDEYFDVSDDEDELRKAIEQSLEDQENQLGEGNRDPEDEAETVEDEPAPTATTSDVQPQSSAYIEPTSLSYSPVNFRRCKLMLIIDGREQTGTGKARGNKKSIAEHLIKLGVDFQTRTLSVGDYLWVMRLENGYEEMVLDYVVERKTWEDLKHSIRQTRYLEQKRRLKETGIRNVIVIAEGAPTSDMALEQALITSSIDNRFMVQRTANVAGTAKFLKSVTDRLLKRCEHEHIIGPSYETFTDESRKTKTLTVGDCWLRQLTVCPLMSIERALQIYSRFPTFRSLADFYRNNRDVSSPAMDPSLLLHSAVPQISKSLSAQVALFFKEDCC